MRALLLFLLDRAGDRLQLASAQTTPRGLIRDSAPGAAICLTWAVPSGGSSARPTSSSYDAMVAKELRDQDALIEDAEVSEYLQRLGAKLGAQTPDGSPQLPFLHAQGPGGQRARRRGRLCVRQLWPDPGDAQ